MEIKRDYQTGRPDTLVRNGYAYRIHVPEQSNWVQGDHYMKPVYFTGSDQTQDEDGRIDFLGLAAKTSSWLVTEPTVMEVAVLEGEAHFVGVVLGKNRKQFELEHHIIRVKKNEPEAYLEQPQINLRKDLLYTWLGGEGNTTILTTSRPSFRTSPLLIIEDGLQRVTRPRRTVPQGYWDYLKNLQQFLQRRNTQPANTSDYAISLYPNHQHLFRHPA